jgi:hypothetical protein
MTNNHAIDYLAVDLTGLLDLEKPQLRDPEPGPFDIQIKFTQGNAADVVPPQAILYLPEGVRPTADMLNAAYFRDSPNPRPFNVQCGGELVLIDSHATWVDLCATIKGELKP